MGFNEVLEWTMGWAWPVMIILGALIAWGIGRVLTWGEEELKGAEPSDAALGEACVCTCRQ